MTNVIAEYNWVLRTEFPLIWWLERQGYNLTYTDDLGVHSQPAAAASAAHEDGGDRRPQRVLDQGDARQRGGGARRGREHRLLQRQHGLLAGSPRGRRPVARVLQDGAEPRCEPCRTAGTDGVNDFGPGNTAAAVPAGDPLGADTPREAPAPTRTIRAWPPPPSATRALPRVPQARPTTSPGGRDYEGLGRVGPNRPENALFGVMYIGDDDNVSYPLEVPAGPGSNGEFGAHPAWRHTTIAGNGGRHRHQPRGLGVGRDTQGRLLRAFAGRQPAGVKRLAETVPDGRPGAAISSTSTTRASPTPVSRAGQGPEIQA